MKFYTRKRRLPTVIIVALIDIFVILLIFVIVTTTFKRSQPSVAIKLPESTSRDEVPFETREKSITLQVSPEGTVVLGDQPLADNTLETMVAALRPLLEAERPLALEADTEAPFGVVLRVMDALKQAGAKGTLPAFTEQPRKK